MKPVIERRMHDRRKRDKGPPAGWKFDRRRVPERRNIEVMESTLEEFEAWLMQANLKTGT